MRFNYDSLMPADIIGDKTIIPSTYFQGVPVPIGAGIRAFQNLLCQRRYGPGYPRVRHNHNALVIPPDQSRFKEWTVGEAINEGSVQTRLSEYEKLMQEEKDVFDFYRLIGITWNTGSDAVEKWHKEIEGKPYDFPGIALYALACLWFPGEMALECYETTFGDKLIWCTKDVTIPLNLNPDIAPAPFHIQQMAGELPSKLDIVLRNITHEIIID